MKTSGAAGHNYDEEEEEETVCERPVKKSNSLPQWGNEKTMNLNTLILTNIQSSQYFKVNLYQLKTYHEVIDEIYYQVSHLEPWEKGSRKTSGQTGMCGGVRGVGAGGIVSTAFCILYKLYTLKLTRKQVLGLMNHGDSPYIRGLGFMYIRFTQPPADLWGWFEPFLDDEEEIDVRAGGGQTTTIGAVVRHMLSKLDWYATLFPRIPVPIQKDIEKRLNEREPPRAENNDRYDTSDYGDNRRRRDEEPNGNRRERYERDEIEDRRDRDDRKDRERDGINDRKDRERDGMNDRKDRERDGINRDRERDDRYGYKERDDKYGDRERNDRYGDKEREKYRDKDRDRDGHRHRDRHAERSSEKEKDRYREKDRSSRDQDRYHSSSKRHHRNRYESSYSYELEREKERIKKERRTRSRSRSRDRSRKYRTH